MSIPLPYVIYDKPYEHFVKFELGLTPIIPIQQGYLCDIYIGSLGLSDPPNGLQFRTRKLGSFYYGSNNYFQFGTGPGTLYTGLGSVWAADFGSWLKLDSGTVFLVVNGLGIVGSSLDYGNSQFAQYTKLSLRYWYYNESATLYVSQDQEQFLGPVEYINGIGTYFLAKFNYITFPWKRTYTSRNYATIACGELGKTQYSESVPFSESKPRVDYKDKWEYVPFNEIYRFSPRKYNESFQITENTAFISVRHGTITDWQFKPQYNILFGSRTEFATTSWNIKVNSYGNIRKSIKHWTGDYEIGNCELELIDESNELYGSLYGGGLESRYKEMVISALINDYEYTWVQQFKGEINRTDWEDGKLRIDLKDKMRNLPSRQFIYDYQNLGTYRINGKKWGCVNRTFGTQVMFDDYGEIKYLQTKQKGKTYLESIFSGIIGGVTGFIQGGPITGVIGFGVGVAGNLPTKDRVTGGYYEISDYDIIPDDLVKSGQRIKFYSGSINGIATNLNSPLAKRKEYTIKSGTFHNGIKGTFSFEDIQGININDLVYVKKPIYLFGNPKDIIYGLLCGSNIDYPYNTGWVQLPLAPPWGGGSRYESSISDFDFNFESELNNLQLFQLERIISSDEETSPFEEVKSLCSDLQLSFYIDENNRFAIKSIRPRNLVSADNIATYSWNTNILDGFKFSRSIDDVLSGIKIFYNYTGDSQKSRYDGYDSLVEVSAPSPITNNANVGSLFSKWITNSDDAKVIGYRTLIHQQKGIDKITIPTTLFGVIQNVTDVIRVTHPTGSLTNKLFEIEGYDKQFDESKVTLEAVDVESAYGYGNCRWYGSFDKVSATYESGHSINGMLIPTGGTFAKINGTVSAISTFFPVIGVAGADSYFGHLVLVGSSYDKNTEIVYIKSYSMDGGVGGYQVTRGLFNTISRRYFTNEWLYDLGVGQYDQFEIMGSQMLLGTYNFGSTFYINPNIGNSFKFF